MSKDFLSESFFNITEFKKKISTTKGRLAGIDFGTRKIGIALTDDSQNIVFPHEIYYRKNFERDFNYFIHLIQNYKIIGLIIGVPLMDNKLGNEKLYIKIKEFFKLLQKQLSLLNVNIPHYFCDESFSSQFANQYLFEHNIINKQRKKMTDKIAAALILQEILDILKD